MTGSQTDMNAAEARAALSWLIAMGADEIVQEEPCDRFAVEAAPRAPAPPAEAPVAAPVPLSEASPAHGCRSIGELEQALRELTDCALLRTASNLCFAGGNLNGHTMVIGDVAGSEEDREGKVFAGSALALLERMLAAIGLSPEESAPPERAVSLFNLIPWRPPGNRPPTPQEIEQCLPFLARAIEIVEPRFILCFGSLPPQALLQRQGSLMTMRGKWFELGIAGRRPIPLIATFPPRMLLQQRAQKRLTWRDLLALEEKMQETA
jgi:DNA polymerase